MVQSIGVWITAVQSLKKNTLALGSYPLITLEMARVRRDDTKKMLINEIDPAEDRNANKEKSTGEKRI